MRGKVVLITGATSGLGEALSHEFYNKGCQVILVARRKNELERVKNDLLNSRKHLSRAATHIPIILTLDLNEIDSIPEKIASVLTICQHIDILVNNAGISFRGKAVDTKIEVDVHVMRVNYVAQVAITKAILPSMIERRSGHIVVISSIQGLLAVPERTAYTASKHAVQGYFDSLRVEVAQFSIFVTVISPGYINTNLSMNAITSTGEIYGVTDDTTAKGYSAGYMAREILKKISQKQREAVIATFIPRVMVWIRRLFPGIYFWIMIRRYLKK